MSESVSLPKAVYEAIITHAREGKPEEICGLVRGAGLQAQEAIRATNVAQERIENYDIDNKTLLYFATHEDEMVGVYHSHPVSAAYPSATDAWNAHYPDKIYFICSLEHDESPVIRAFRMTAHFLDLDIPMLRGSIDFYETRPGLFAYYQAAGAPIPAVLAGFAGEAPAPFYLVYFEEGEEIEGRLVSLSEHPITVSESTQ
jgi:proteasome lid subunit RPN8/RPN11